MIFVTPPERTPTEDRFINFLFLSDEYLHRIFDRLHLLYKRAFDSYASAL
jgi:hypothetical protein